MKRIKVKELKKLDADVDHVFLVKHAVSDHSIEFLLMSNTTLIAYLIALKDKLKINYKGMKKIEFDLSPENEDNLTDGEIIRMISQTMEIKNPELVYLEDL